MSKNNSELPDDHSAPEEFESEIRHLVSQLKSALGDGATRWYYDEPSDILYVELESLSGMTDEEVAMKAGSILEDCELDFEEIILLPFTQ